MSDQINLKRVRFELLYYLMALSNTWGSILSNWMGSSGPILASLKWLQNIVSKTGLLAERITLWNLKSYKIIRHSMLVYISMIYIFTIIKHTLNLESESWRSQPTLMVQSWKSPVSNAGSKFNWCSLLLGHFSRWQLAISRFRSISEPIMFISWRLINFPSQI